METWFLIIVTLCISSLIKSLFNLFFQSKKQSLPPGPVKFPIIGNVLWLRKSFFELESIIRSLHKELGPMITLHIGSRPNIFIADRSLAHQALVRNGTVFANRPRAPATTKITTHNQHSVNSAFYGPTWRLLRRNLTSEILHPSRVKSYSHARKWVLEILLNRFESQSKSGDPVLVVDNFQYAMFCLLVLMCFGDKLDQKQIEEIERVERTGLLSIRRFDKLNFMPRLTKIVFRKRWSEFLQLQKDREEVLIPLIRARKKVNEEIKSKNCNNEFVLSYVDTLFDLQLPDEKRKLREKEMVALCNEFLNAGTDTTSTALQWVMANLVKYPYIQEKLFMEIKSVVADGEEEVKEDDLQKMSYLKAVILEGLRRHPPTHFVLPHAVTEDVVLGKYLVPKNANINFMVAEMGWDPEVWEEPMAFKPERFMGSDSNGEVFDITGSREIKMMPFGVGRRICPGYGLALLHLEYFVANLVWNFQWKAIDGDDIDLSEKQQFTIVMKNPLQAHISPRFKRNNHNI
ncbi:cytochrome P450 89A2 [Ricinus communis]|uniref:Cytochrome P450, putative n=1 Tax=Ricinus communis TaxID=3988 RepID=B9SDH1_RICCO|nr:cytochrome P450 89A2 [Ricinus communis]EEF38408.1 cytochrome P450, putative [Ricinus communis]|eukprot:XP_002524040.1 cytochrome P450 89A2 [Ricinus communis]